jgi:hypothetical protein
MVQNLKTAYARGLLSWLEEAEAESGNGEFPVAAQATAMRRKGSPSAIRTRLGTRSESIRPIPQDFAASPAAPPIPLSVRAENVLKQLAMELTGECPPKGRWIPPDRLLLKLTFGHLQTARNCGPQTIAEIVGWAELRGVTIRPPSHAGKSLSNMWQDLVARISSGEFTTAEIAEALERSARRKNTQIPVAFQNVLLKVLNSTRK